MGTTAAAVEKELGFCNGYINSLKPGAVPYDKIRRLADRLDTTIDYLLYGEESKPIHVEVDRLSYERRLISRIERLSDYQVKIMLDIIGEMTGDRDGDR